MSQKIVILGGGYGGVLTTKKLSAKFKKNDSIEITLIDKNPYHTMLTELHEVAAGRINEDSIRIYFEKIFAGRKVKVIQDYIQNIDFKKQVLKSNQNDYSYDYLVIGTGSQPNYFGIKGAKEFAHSLWSYEDAVNLRNHILNMFRLAMNEPDVEKRRKYLTFIVAGAGFTGVEMIGELAEWKGKLCKEFHIDPSEVKLYLVDMLPEILTMLPYKLIKKAERMLQKMGIEIITNTPISCVNMDSVLLKNNRNILSYTCIWTAGTECSDITDKLDISKKVKNRIVTGPKLQSVDYSNVYVVGDNIYYIPEGETELVPQMVENCEQSSALIAHNISADINQTEHKTYKPNCHGVMVSMGGRHGVAYVGTHKKKIGLPSLPAMFVKHFINIIYFFQVAGWNKVHSYLLHEIFHVPDRRSFLGGHLSKRSPNFWLVPLRLFIGVQWLIEGIGKLPKIIKDPTNIFLFQLPNADSTSGASPAKDASQWGEALPVPDFISDIVDWSMSIFIEPIAPWFQAGMVLGEIVTGLLLIGGLFYLPASCISLAMAVMIYLSGMASPDILWYMVVSIALIGGSGSTFGLDYYVLPFLKKYWKKIGLVKKWYLFND